MNTDMPATSAASPPETHTPPEVSCAQLFFGFMRIGATGVGGVLPQAHHQLVEKRRWLAAAEFTEMLSLGQLLPGPNIVNVSIMVGTRYQGPCGALASLAGLILVPFFVVLSIAEVYRQIGNEPWVRPFFQGVAAGVGGLVFATGFKLLRAQPRRVWIWTLALGAFALIAIARLPLIPVLLGLAPVALILARLE